MQLAEQPPLGKSYFGKYRAIILVLVVVIVVLGALFIPYIPNTVTLQYNSQLCSSNGISQWYVNVTNEGSIGGTFSATINLWLISDVGAGQAQLENASSQSFFIKAGATKTFYFPSGWFEFDFF